jgi:hypothetical protein
MAKPSTTEKPKAVDTLVAIVEMVIPHRFADRQPSLGDVARLTNTASRTLRFQDVDERISVENAVTLAVARKLQLVS